MGVTMLLRPRLGAQGGRAPASRAALPAARAAVVGAGAALAAAAALVGLLRRRRRRWLRTGRVLTLMEEEEGGSEDGPGDLRLARAWERVEARAMGRKRAMAIAVVPRAAAPGSWDGALSGEFARLSRALRRVAFVEVRLARRRAAGAGAGAAAPGGLAALGGAVARVSEVAAFFCASLMQTGDDAVLAERRRRGYAHPSMSYPSSLNNETTRLTNRDVFLAMAKEERGGGAALSPSLDAVLSRAAPTIPTVVLLHHAASRLKLRAFPTNDEDAREELRRLLLHPGFPGLNRAAQRRQPQKRRRAPRPPTIVRPVHVRLRTSARARRAGGSIDD